MPNLITYLNLSGVELGVDQRLDTKMTHVSKRLDYVLKFCQPF